MTGISGFSNNNHPGNTQGSDYLKNFNIIFGKVSNLLYDIFVLKVDSTIQFHDMPISIAFTNEKENHESVHIFRRR
jgi:hypothetical protein